MADSVQLFADDDGRPGELLEDCAVGQQGDYECLYGGGRLLILRATLGSAIQVVAFESLLTSDGCHPVTQTVDVMLDEP